MRTKIFFSVMVCLFFAILSCSKNDDGGDCSDIAFSADGRKLISPQWMVNIFKSIEKYAVDSKAYSYDQRYEVYSIEYEQNTYIKIANSWDTSAMITGPFYNCSGEIVIPEYIYIIDIPSYRGLVEVLDKEKQLLFIASFCYNPSDNCEYGFGTNYKSFIP